MTRASDLDAIRHTVTADLPPVDAAARAAAWQRLQLAVGAPAPVRPRRPSPRRSWRLAVRVALAALSIAVALTVIVAVSGRDGSAPVPAPFAVPPAQAAVILSRAAQHLAKGSPLTGSQARVVREDWLQLVVGADHHGHVYRYVLPRTTEEGYDALGNAFYEELPDGRPRFASVAARDAYTRQFGRYVPIPPKPRIEWHYGPSAPDPNVLNLSAHEVLALPTDPAALRARLLALRPGLAAQSEERDPVGLISRLLTAGPTPPAVQSALARILATLPGVRRAGITTVGGHQADVLAFPAPRGVGVSQHLAFDRRSGELLEEIDVLVRRSRGLPGVKPGEVINAIAYSPIVAPTIDAKVHPPAVTPIDGPRP
jgi:hypothetical protein